MQCKWAFLSLSLLSGIYVSAGIQTHYLTIPKHWAGQNMWIKPHRLVCMTKMTSIMSTSLVLLLLFVRVKRRFQQYFSHITTVSGYDRALNAHWSIMPQTFDLIPHPVTLSWHCFDQSKLFPVSLSAKRGAACTIFKGFGMNRDLKFPWADTLPGQVHPLCAHVDTVHACASSLCLDVPEVSKYCIM